MLAEHRWSVGSAPYDKGPTSGRGVVGAVLGVPAADSVKEPRAQRTAVVK